MQKKNGISLIVLVITIIIMIILTGSVIISLQNSRIIDNSKKGVEQYTDEQLQEQIKYAFLQYKLDKLSNKDINISNYIEDYLVKTYGDENVDIKGNDTLSINIKYNGKDYKYALKANGILLEGVLDEYNKNGLVLLLDGIKNTRNGHNLQSSNWEDLSGNNNDFNSVGNLLWSNNSYVGDGTNRTLSINKTILENTNECTVEICYSVSRFNDYWVFQSRQIGGQGNGFQFTVSSNGNRSLSLFNSIDNNPNKLSIDYLGKATIAFAIDNDNIVFSDNANFTTEETHEGTINSIINRGKYTIGSASPWNGYSFLFEGEIYSIRIYNRKLSNEELKNNYEVDRLRFDMD